MPIKKTKGKPTTKVKAKKKQKQKAVYASGYKKR